MRRLRTYLAYIEDERLREAVAGYMGLYWRKFRRAPASISYHNIHDGGLLKHTLEVADFGIKMIKSLELGVDLGHYVVAALLHDMGKLDRYYYDGKEWQYYKKDAAVTSLMEGRRIDHALKPILEFEAFTKVPLPLVVQLAILSHMGGWSKTSVYPDDVLSSVLHSADIISSRVGKV